MLHRNKKPNDPNEGKWIGVGGKFENNESPEDCLIREVKEETGLDVKSFKLNCIVTYISNEWETEYMYVFTVDKFEGDLIECDEGDLKWVEKEKIFDLNLWEGDKIFMRKVINKDNFFTVKYIYEGNDLKDYFLYEY